MNVLIHIFGAVFSTAVGVGAVVYLVWLLLDGLQAPWNYYYKTKLSVLGWVARLLSIPVALVVISLAIYWFGVSMGLDPVHFN
jgi:hypothetical protein